jgi:hypothetical protein
MIRMESFDASIYHGYEAQRTHPASFRGEPPSTTGAHYYIFAVDKSLQPADPRRGGGSTSQSSTLSEKKVRARDGDQYVALHLK